MVAAIDYDLSPGSKKSRTSYQILVASSKEKPEMNASDIRNSKKILSNISSEIEFGGDNLAVKSTLVRNFVNLRSKTICILQILNR